MIAIISLVGAGGYGVILPLVLKKLLMKIKITATNRVLRSLDEKGYHFFKMDNDWGVIVPMNYHIGPAFGMCRDNKRLFVYGEGYCGKKSDVIKIGKESKAELASEGRNPVFVFNVP